MFLKLYLISYLPTLFSLYFSILVISDLLLFKYLEQSSKDLNTSITSPLLFINSIFFFPPLLIIDLYFLKNPVSCIDTADEVIELLNKKRQLILC